ncbi:MAG: hypothetical protein WC551_02635 [Patescibacteria group bacterium]
MQFSDTSTLTGIIQSVEDLTNLGDGAISGNTTQQKKFARHANTASRKIWSWIFETYGGWQYDDSNQTDLPQAATNLVAGTNKYPLPSDALTVQRVEVKDPNGNYVKLEPIAIENVGDGLENLAAQTGTPTGYRMIGTTVEILPNPSYSSTNGFKVYFDRDIVAFASTDTTKEPGFASPYHNAVAVGAALEWMRVKQPSNPVIIHLKEEWGRYERDIRDFYSKRFAEYRPRLRTQTYNWK